MPLIKPHVPVNLTWWPLAVWRRPFRWFAPHSKKTRIPLAIETLDETIKTLLAVRKKGDETAIWEITESERQSVLIGICMAEQCIGTLDVALLAQTAAKLLQSV